MKGLIRKSDGQFVTAVESTEGYDLTEFDAHELPPGDPTQWKWDGTAFVTRDPTAAEVTEAALLADARWQQLANATPAQVETYLAEHMTTLAESRRIVKILVLAIQRLARTRT